MTPEEIAALASYAKGDPALRESMAKGNASGLQRAFNAEHPTARRDRSIPRDAFVAWLMTNGVWTAARLVVLTPLLPPINEGQMELTAEQANLIQLQAAAWTCLDLKDTPLVEVDLTKPLLRQMVAAFIAAGVIAEGTGAALLGIGRRPALVAEVALDRTLKAPLTEAEIVEVLKHANA